MNKIKMILINNGTHIGFMITTAIFTFFPGKMFDETIVFNKNWAVWINGLVFRLILVVSIFFVSELIFWIVRINHKHVLVEDGNTIIRIEYGDLLKIQKGTVIIPFDECFTTKIGNNPCEIKPDSICGQFLQKHPINDSCMQKLIKASNVKPEKEKSQYNNQKCYMPGTTVRYGDYLLLAFTKLDTNGRGEMSYHDYLCCLNKLWEQIDIYHGTSDVYIPILGSKIINFNDANFSQQQLLDIILCSYRLSSQKLKLPYKLHIVCQKREGFSLNKVMGIK